MNASSVLHATTLGLFLALAAGCASTAPRTQAQSPASAPALESAGTEPAAATSPATAPNDYDWTMPDSKPRTAKSDATPATDLKPSQATSGQSVLKSVE